MWTGYGKYPLVSVRNAGRASFSVDFEGYGTSSGDPAKTRLIRKPGSRIIGDYDIDGVTATYILLDGISQRLGASGGYLYSGQSKRRIRNARVS
ncbi:MAG: hypothetical protein ACLRIT_12095 [Blautia sp.]